MYHHHHHRDHFYYCWMNLETNVALHQNVSWYILMLSPLVATILVVWRPPTYGKLQEQPLQEQQHEQQRRRQKLPQPSHPGNSTMMTTPAATTGKRMTSGTAAETTSKCGIKQGATLFGPTLSAQWCWMIFESPNWLWVGYALYRLGHVPPFPNTMLLGWFLWHYLYRSLWYPLQMSKTSKFPVGIMALSFSYCMINGYLQSFGLCFFQSFSITKSATAISTFVLGYVVMMIGFSITIRSDQQLVRLRRTYTTYQIPRGGWFDYVSCPHYLGEIMEWMGFCIACQGSWASLSFALWTMANLIPRALAQHEWYQRTFPKTYPKDRKAILPFWL